MKSATPTALKLRELILSGELQPGERVSEAGLAERLGLSRQPVRQALPALAEEGLLVLAGHRGYAVRAFTHRESLQALRMRAVLEGYAARQLAERGASGELIRQMQECLAEGDALFGRCPVTEEDELRYGEMNVRLHSLVLESSDNPLLLDLIARCHLVPFTAPGAIAFTGVARDKVFELLFHAHRQHHSIVDAIARKQPDRAEFLFREHALTQEQSMHERPAAGYVRE